MPDYRKLHNGHGNSQKLGDISDFEFRVWNQIRASADDFGVCPLSPPKLQGDNRRLAKEPALKVQKAILRLIEVELIVPFNHQGQTYLCQLNWQDFEDIRYPRQSLHPVPSAEIFPLLSEKTSELFREHRKKDYGKFPHLARAGARETLTFTQTQRQTLTETETRIEGEGAGEGTPAPPVDPVHAELWSRLLEAMAAISGMSERILATWFRPCAVIGVYPDAIRVAVPSVIFLEWLPKHYSVVVGEAVAKVAPGKTVRYELAQRRVS